MDRHEDLTPAEQRYLERAGEAQQHGLTLQQYYQASGLSLDWLHKIRRQLLRKGVVTPERSAQTAAVRSREFVEVRVAAAPTVKSESIAICRLHHPSGWVIECGSWPEPSWMAALLGERR
jgi:hypothetical protein